MKNTIYILLLGTLLLFSSCEDFFEQTVTIDLPKEAPKLSATALFFQGGYSEETVVMVSKSVAALDDETSSLLSNAIVKLFSDGTLVADFTEKDGEKDGVYYPASPITFEEGKTYKLEISAEGFKTISATQTYPSKPAFSDVKISKGKKIFSLILNDKVGPDYYLIKASGLGVDDNILSNTSGLNFRESILSDQTFDGQDITQSFPIYGFNSFDVGDSTTIEISKVGEDYYRFDRTVYNSEYSFGPFSEPVILHRNFKNGYGVFTLGNRKRIRIAISE